MSLLAAFEMLAALANQAEVYVCIFCDGRAGYSRIEDRETIVARRKIESAAAYAARAGMDAVILTTMEMPLTMRTFPNAGPKR